LHDYFGKWHTQRLLLLSEGAWVLPPVNPNNAPAHTKGSQSVRAYGKWIFKGMVSTLYQICMYVCDVHA